MRTVIFIKLVILLNFSFLAQNKLAKQIKRDHYEVHYKTKIFNSYKDSKFRTYKVKLNSIIFDEHGNQIKIIEYGEKSRKTIINKEGLVKSMLFDDRSKINSITFQKFDSLNRIVFKETWGYLNNNKDNLISNYRYEYIENSNVKCYSFFYLNKMIDTNYFKLISTDFIDPLNPNAKFNYIYCKNKGNNFQFDSIECYSLDKIKMKKDKDLIISYEYDKSLKEIIKINRVYLDFISKQIIRDSEIDLIDGDEKMNIYIYNKKNQIKKIKMFWYMKYQRIEIFDGYMEFKYKKCKDFD